MEELTYTIDGSGNIVRINDSTYGYDGFNRVTRANTKLPDRVDYVGLVADHFGAYETSPTVEGAVYNAVADLNGDGRINGVDHVAAILTERREGNAYDEETFTYDRAGNRVTLTQNGDTYRYTTGERNRLTGIDLRKAGETTFVPYAASTYDAAGSMIERVVYTDTGIETTTYTYDSLNRLVQTDGPSGAASYTYDGVGNRVTKRDAEGLTIYLRHGEIAVAMEVSVPTTGEATVDRYVLSGNLIAGRVRTEGGTTERAYYHLDHLNSTKLVTDEGGEILVSYILPSIWRAAQAVGRRPERGWGRSRVLLRWQGVGRHELVLLQRPLLRSGTRAVYYGGPDTGRGKLVCVCVEQSPGVGGPDGVVSC